MPSTTQEFVNTVETQVLDGIRRAQDAVVKAVQTWAEAGKNVAPALRPVTKRLPSASTWVNHGFSLADRVLTNQKNFALALLKAVEPVLGSSRSKPTAVRGPAGTVPSSSRPKASTKPPAAATA